MESNNMLEANSKQLQVGLMKTEEAMEEGQQKNYQFLRKINMKKLSSWQAHKLYEHSPRRKMSQRYNLSILNEKNDPFISGSERYLKTDETEQETINNMGTIESKQKKKRITLPDVFQPKNLIYHRNCSTKRSLSTNPFSRNTNVENRNEDNEKNVPQKYKRHSFSQVSNKYRNLNMRTLEIENEEIIVEKPLKKFSNHNQIMNTLPEYQDENNMTFGYQKIKNPSSVQKLRNNSKERDTNFATLQEIPSEHYMTFGSNFKEKAIGMQKYRSLEETPKSKEQILCHNMVQVQRKLFKKINYQVGMTALDEKIIEGIKSMKRIYS